MISEIHKRETMSTTDQIREHINACLRSRDEEGDYGAIFSLAKLCKDGCSLQVLEMLKRPLKNSNDVSGQIRMVNLLEQLANNANWGFRSNIASEKWMSRLIDVAKGTRSGTIQLKIPQLIVDWAALYSRDPSLYGFQEFGASRLAAARLSTPSPSISPTIGHATSSSRAAPPVVAPLSSGYSSRANPGNAIQSTFGRPGTTATAAYGVKTAAPPGFRSSAAMPPRQTSLQGVSHRDPGFKVHDLDMFLCDLDADVTALTNGLQRTDLAETELPELARTLETNRLKINEFMNTDTSEDANMKLLEAYQNIEEALECYRALYAGGQFSDAGADSDREEILSDDGFSQGTPSARKPVDLSNNATAARLGLAPVDTTDTATGELERLRAELKLAAEKEQRLQREVDELKGENMSLKASGGGAVMAGGGGGGGGGGGKASAQTVAALRGFIAKSKVIIQTCRDQQMEMVKNVEESQNYMGPNFERCLQAMTSLSRRPNNEALIKKLQQDYLKEMKLRKEYFNKIQELRGNIRVFCRVRPLSKKEIEQHSATDVTSYPDADEVCRLASLTPNMKHHRLPSRMMARGQRSRSTTSTECTRHRSRRSLCSWTPRLLWRVSSMATT